MKEADLLFEFGMLMCRVQSKGGRYYAHEHLTGASSWKNNSVTQLCTEHNGHLVRFHQCRYGLCTPFFKKPVRKSTTIMANIKLIKEEFQNKFCTCKRPHHRIQGQVLGRPLAAHCARYPPPLCKALAATVASVWEISSTSLE